jgi:putative holliday junction resolvase
MTDDSKKLRLLPTEQPIPTQGRLAGIDFGTVRIGIASCDPTQTWVTPYATYTRKNEQRDAEYLLDLVEREHLVGWVIGLPIHCDGNESQKSKEVRVFAEWLGGLSQLPVALFDERFSTAEARRLLRDTGLSPQKKKQNLDRLAAHLILTNYLEFRKSGFEASAQAPQNQSLDDG